MLAWLPQTQVVLPLGSSDRLPVSAWPHLLPTWYSQRSLAPAGQVQALADPLCYVPLYQAASRLLRNCSPAGDCSP